MGLIVINKSSENEVAMKRSLTMTKNHHDNLDRITKTSMVTDPSAFSDRIRYPSPTSPHETLRSSMVNSSDIDDAIDAAE